MTLIQLFTSIANAIRNKKGTSETIQAEDFPNEIENIPGIIPTGTVEITENGIYDVTNYANATVNVSGGGDIDDYFDKDVFRGSSNSSGLNRVIKKVPENIRVAENITAYMFFYCTSLEEIPWLDTSNVTSMSNMFHNCFNLKHIPVLETSKATAMTSMFSSCNSLTNESLNNVLIMCINARLMSGTRKTLKHIGISQEQALICQELPSWQAFLNAGWSTGY